jgi:hypothetical protein
MAANSLCSSGIEQQKILLTVRYSISDSDQDTIYIDFTISGSNATIRNLTDKDL